MPESADIRSVCRTFGLGRFFLQTTILPHELCNEGREHQCCHDAKRLRQFRRQIGRATDASASRSGRGVKTQLDRQNKCDEHDREDSEIRPDGIRAVFGHELFETLR